MNPAVNLQVARNAGNVLTIGGPVSLLGRNLSMELVGLLVGYGYLVISLEVTGSLHVSHAYE